MSRAKRGFKARHRRKKILKLAKGYRGSRRSRYAMAIQVVRRGLVYAFRDRRVKKRNFRSLWITRINAAARNEGLKYSEFIHGLSKLKVALDRSVLADLALRDQAAFKEIADKVKGALNLKTGT
jgi:large subunit ribosomal protein L20